MDYKKILEGVVDIINTTEKSDIGFANICTYIGENCPELAEPEDERIRKDIIILVKDWWDRVAKDNISTKEQMLAWLEKQGEQKPTVVPKFRIGDTITPKGKKEYYTITDIVDGWYEFKEKHVNGGIPINYQFGWELVEQNTADKIESKFHEGDWIVRELDNTCYQIKKCILNVTNNKYGYDLTNGGYISSQDTNFYHLWTIQDAKDGDVLVASDGSIFLFRGTFGSSCKHYVALATDGAVKFNEGLEHYWETSTAVHPATKEQRDTLEKAMTDAGYTFDFEKKELKKIEQKTTDKKGMNLVEEKMTPFQKKVFCIIDTAIEEEQGLKQVCDELLRLAHDEIEQKPAWSEEDEAHLIILDSICESSEAEYYDHPESLGKEAIINAKNWLKTLKNRIQSQNRWKPSDEQIGVIEAVINNRSFQRRHLDSLYEQLKKLREE